MHLGKLCVRASDMLRVYHEGRLERPFQKRLQSLEVTWSEAEGMNPLSEFVAWLPYSFDKAYTTYAFAHYGTRVVQYENFFTSFRRQIRHATSRQ